MDTQTSAELSPTEFLPGTSVIYAMHGKCMVLGTETRSLGGQTLEFYKLEMKKTSPTRSTRGESAIWVPVANARDQGLRRPMSPSEAELALKALMSREYFFKINDSWSSLLPTLEEVIRKEGGLGLAKVASFLYVYRRKQFTVPAEATKLQDLVNKFLLKELSEALQDTTKNIEIKIAKGLKTKLLPDH
jgi:RNA polymerase-interacting CarD/CdnL/TRCF family regulator